ncbi:MAG: HEPN domain-containing protein [bacterium]
MKTGFLKERAEIFFESATEQLKKKHYFLSAFSFEQATQLYLKYCLLIKLRDFPKIHELEKLLLEVGKTYRKQKETDRFLKKQASVIGDLNQTYITSRYLPVEFNRYQVEKMGEFVEVLIKFLKKICPEASL